MRSFLQAFASSLLTFAGYGTARDRSHGKSIALKSLARNDRLSTMWLDDEQLRPDLAQYDAGAAPGRKRHVREDDSVASDGSRRVIIRRHTDIQVQR